MTLASKFSPKGGFRGLKTHLLYLKSVQIIWQCKNLQAGGFDNRRLYSLLRFQSLVQRFGSLDEFLIVGFSTLCEHRRIPFNLLEPVHDRAEFIMGD